MGMILFFGHHWLLPSSSEYTFFMWNLLSAPPINQEPRLPQPLLQLFPWQPEPSQRAHQTTVGPSEPLQEYLHLPFKTQDTTPEPLSLALMPTQLPSLRVCRTLSSGHLKADTRLCHGSFPVEIIIIIHVIPVRNHLWEKSKDSPMGSFVLLIFFLFFLNSVHGAPSQLLLQME